MGRLAEGVSQSITSEVGLAVSGNDGVSNDLEGKFVVCGSWRTTRYFIFIGRPPPLSLNLMQ